MKIPVAVVGSGKYGWLHAKAYQALPDVRLVALCDPGQKTAEGYSPELCVPTFALLEDMLSRFPEIEALSIVSEHPLANATTALSYGKHILVPGLSSACLQEITPLMEIAVKKRLLFFTDTSLSVAEADSFRSVLSAADIGVPLSFRANITFSPRQNTLVSGMDDAFSPLFSLVHLLSGKITHIQCFARSFSSLIEVSPLPFTAGIHFMTESGIIGHSLFRVLPGQEESLSLEIQGTKGGISLPEEKLLPFFSHREKCGCVKSFIEELSREEIFSGSSPFSFFGQNFMAPLLYTSCAIESNLQGGNVILPHRAKPGRE